MDDDLNTPRAIATIEALAKQINTANDEVARDPALATSELTPGLDHARSVFHQLTGVLGLDLEESVHATQAGDDDVQRLVDERTEARRRKDFAAADRLRKELVDMGVTIEDRPQGTIWYRA
jgi:cysteinyl-tRNA synthetase